MTFFDDFLNFIIPISVFGFLIWIIYRIPIFREMINWVLNKFKDMRERRQNSQGSQGSKIQSIQYE